MFDFHASLGFPPIKFSQPELIVWKESKTVTMGNEGGWMRK